MHLWLLVIREEQWQHLWVRIHGIINCWVNRSFSRLEFTDGIAVEEKYDLQKLKRGALLAMF